MHANNIRFYEGIRIVSGYIWGRLWGVYTDPNYAGVMVTISILFSLYILPSIQNRLAKGFFIANIILQGFYICFSDSRTAMVAALKSKSRSITYSGHTRYPMRQPVMAQGLLKLWHKIR